MALRRKRRGATSRAASSARARSGSAMHSSTAPSFTRCVNSGMRTAASAGPALRAFPFPAAAVEPEAFTPVPPLPPLLLPPSPLPGVEAPVSMPVAALEPLAGLVVTAPGFTSGATSLRTASSSVTIPSTRSARAVRSGAGSAAAALAVSARTLFFVLF